MRALPQKKLDVRIISVWKLSALISVAVSIVVYVIIGGILATLTSIPVWAIVAVAAALVIIHFVTEFVVLPKVRYARWRYEVTTTEIDIMSGIFFKSRIIVPLVRVQYVDTSQGPILRYKGLASVEITTAGGSVSIPGLAVEEADMLRDRVAVLARIAQEDV